MVPEQSHVEIRFGKAAIQNVTHWTVTDRLNALPDANARFLFSEAELNKPDYAASVSIVEVTGRTQQPLFHGVADGVEAKDGVVSVTFHNDPGLAETTIRGWGFVNVTPQELFWSAAREAGYEEERINIAGWSPGPSETFEVVAPVFGISLNNDRAIGSVRFTAAPNVRDLASGFSGLEIVDEFRRGPVWALTTVSAQTLLEAEREGLLQIDTVLAWLMARARYSHYQLPSQPPRSWQRTWGEALLERADAVAVRGLSSQRRSLHSPKVLTPERILALDEVADLDSPRLPNSLTPQEHLAIASWRRARVTSQATLAVGALWEALECYAFDISLPQAFSADDAAKVLENALVGLDKVQAKRVRARLSNLNQPPLPDALAEAFNVDGVPVSAAELALLRKLREQRNNSVHGRGGPAPNPADLRYGIAIVARVLLYRIHRRDRESYSIRV